MLLPLFGRFLAISAVATPICLTASFAHSASSAMTSTCQLETPDTGVNGISIADAASAKAQIVGDHELFQDEAGASFLQFASNNGSQSLALIPHSGAEIDSFNEFEVRYRAEEEQLPTLPSENFTSSLGIHLGQSLEDVVSRLGECYRRLPTDTGTEVLLYERVDPPKAEASDVGEFEFGYYYAEYEFDQNRLIRFRFGLEPNGP